jgi:hypothetical protein
LQRIGLGLAMVAGTVNPATDRSMPRFKRRPFSGWFVAAIGLLLISMPILVFNQQHSGDRLKIRRELRKF